MVPVLKIGNRQLAIGNVSRFLLHALAQLNLAPQ